MEAPYFGDKVMIFKMQKRISILIAGLILLSACSPKMDSRIARGFELIKKENYQQAIELLQEVLRDDKRNINALMLLQSAYNEVGDYEQSIVQGKAVLKLIPTIKLHIKTRPLRIADWNETKMRSVATKVCSHSRQRTSRPMCNLD